MPDTGVMTTNALQADSRAEILADRTIVKLGAYDLAQTLVDAAASILRMAHDLETFTNCREDEAIEDTADLVRLAGRSIGSAKAALNDYLSRVTGDETNAETFAYASDAFHREAGADWRNDDSANRIIEGVRRAFDLMGWQELTSELPS